MSHQRRPADVEMVEQTEKIAGQERELYPLSVCPESPCPRRS